MDLTLNSNGGSTRFQIAGAIDERGAEQLKTAFATLQLEGSKEVIFDFGQVTHIGSAGLGKLLMFYQKLASKGLQMRLDNPSAQLRELLAELRLDTLFQVH